MGTEIVQSGSEPVLTAPMLAAPILEAPEPTEPGPKFAAPRKKLTRAEMDSLVAQAQNGDRRAENKVFIISEPMLKKLASGFMKQVHNCTFDELMQEGRFGVLKAIEKFDPNRGSSFLNYAGYWVKAKIDLFVNNNKHSIRLTAHARGKALQYHRTLEHFQAKFDHIPSAKEVMEHLNITKEKLQTMMQAYSIWIQGETTSLDADIACTEDDRKTNRYDLIPDPQATQDVTSVETDQDFDQIVTDIQALIHNTKSLQSKSKPLAMAVLHERIINPDEKSLKKIGEIFNLTRARVQQVEAKIFEIIKKSPAIMEKLELLKKSC
jgi:RNA polymerase primary sigma factor